ncbi:RNA polymerase sigma factor [Butyricimonas paravirosa]
MVYSESEIVHELEAGNEVCLNMLFDNYYRALCVYAFRFVPDADDVEDIVQEVFVSFWMNKKRTVFSGSVRSYLFGAVAKAASKFATRRGRIMFDDVEKYVDQFLEELVEYDESEFARLRDKVYARVEALPEKTKEIFKAVVLDNMTYQQVGDRFGITVNTVKTMYYRALKQLKEELGGNALVLFFIILR